MLNKKLGYWLNEKGYLIKTPFQKHYIVLQKLLNVKLDYNKLVYYYNKALKKGFIKISIFNKELSIQIKKKPTKTQKRIIVFLYKQYDNLYLLYKNKEVKIESILHLNKVIS